MPEIKKTIWARFQWIGKLLGILSTIVAGGFVAYQYFDSKWIARIEKSLSYTVIAQEGETLAARNATNLWPPINRSKHQEVDINLIAKSLSVISDQDFIEQYIPETSILDAPETSKRFREILADRAAARLADAMLDVATGSRSFDDVRSDEERLGKLEELHGNKCKAMIKSYVEKVFDREQETNKKYKEWRERIVTKDGFVTNIGVVVEIEGERHWFEDSVKYHYTWPRLLRSFFRTDHNGNLMESTAAHCRKLTDRFEEEILNVSSELLDNLNVMRNFYASLSICTTSVMCDSQTACELFNADAYRFQEEWRWYLELQAASKTNTGCFRIPEFTKHCNSNYYFIRGQIETLRWYGESIHILRNFFNIW